MKRVLHTSIASTVVLSALALAAPVPVAGCVSAPAPFDSFRATVPDATTIVLGTVEGLSRREVHNHFRLRVDEVLRGEAPAAMRFRGLRGGDARSACGDPSGVSVRDGDRLALAMDAAAPGRMPVVEAVAFVGKSRPAATMPGVERLAARTVRQLAGAPAGVVSGRAFDPGRAGDGLFIERLARGVGRLRSFGNAHDLRTVRAIDVGADERVWATARDRAFKLAARQEYRVDDSARVSGVKALPDGGAFVTADGIWSTTGDKAWYRLGSDADSRLHSPHEAPDGTLRALSDDGLAVLEDYEWVHVGWDKVGVPSGCVGEAGGMGGCAPTLMVDAPDGSTWLGFAGTDPGATVGGVGRLEGSTWTAVPGPVDGSLAVHGLASKPGGPVWALVTTATEPGQPDEVAEPDGPDRLRLARWDGQAWELFDVPEAATPDAALEASGDGSAWLSQPLSRFDGDAWAVYDVPGRAGPERSQLADLSIAPDGTAWMVVRRIDPTGSTRPDGVHVLDPARAEPTTASPSS